MKTGLLTKCATYNFEKLFKEKGYAWFTKGNYNLNIVGIRSNNNNKVTNQYDDILVVDYNTGNGHKRVCYTITTEPGKYYMQNVDNPKGTAILVPGQYRGCFQIGLHRGKYKALCQKKEVKVYRDGNKNMTYDMIPESINKGIFGINIHRSNETWTRKTIDKYSAGCQAFNSPIEFNAFMRLCEEQRKLYGNSFTYTLINEEDMHV